MDSYEEHFGGRGVPLVVNTCGWVRGLGLEALTGILSLVRPNVVLTLEGGPERRRVPLPLDSLPPFSRLTSLPDFLSVSSPSSSSDTRVQPNEPEVQKEGVGGLPGSSGVPGTRQSSESKERNAETRTEEGGEGEQQGGEASQGESIGAEESQERKEEDGGKRTKATPQTAEAGVTPPSSSATAAYVPSSQLTAHSKRALRIAFYLLGGKEGEAHPWLSLMPRITYSR